MGCTDGIKINATEQSAHVTPSSHRNKFTEKQTNSRINGSISIDYLQMDEAHI